MKLLIAGLALAAATLAAPAIGAAGDLPIKAPPLEAVSWTGLYVGGGIGGRWSGSDVTVTSSTGNFLGGIVQNNVAACFAFRNPCFNGANFDGASSRVSPYIGYNWQVDHRWVVGLEADWGWAKQTGTLVGYHYPLNLFNFNPNNSFSVQTRWDASARVRLGYLVIPNVLLYGTGGPAWLRVETTSNCDASAATGFCFPGAFNPATISHARTLTGWTVGGGAEAIIWRNWIVRAEYRYAQFGTFNNTDNRTCGTVPSDSCGTESNEIVSYDTKVRTHTATFGIAYKFDAGSVVARY
jgi:outer membrane immunogenic protein